MTLVPQLSKDELSVLLTVFETPSRAITGNTLYTKYPRVAAKMVKEEWFIPKDTLLTTEIHGELKAVTWRPEANAYQYFSPLLGWTTIPFERLTRYSINIKKYFFWVLSLFNISQTTRSVVLLENSLVRLGAMQIDNHYMTVYLCARLKSMSVISAINNALHQESTQMPSIVVSMKSGITPLTLPDNMTEVTFEALLHRHVTHCQIDPHIIGFTVNNHAPYSSQNKEVVRFSDDYRLVYWGQQKLLLTKTQAVVVKALHHSGGRAHKQFLQSQLDSGEDLHRVMRNRVDDQWVQHPIWNALIVKSGGGYYCFSDEASIEPQVPLFDQSITA